MTRFAIALSSLLFSLLLSPTALADAADASVAPTPPGTPVPYRPRASEYGRDPRDVHIEAAEGAPVVRIAIEGTVDLGQAAFVRRVLEQYEDYAVLLLDINTLGGRVDAAIQIRDALLQTELKTIAFINPRAISAGALIALACDVIVVTEGASMGAATPIQMGDDGAEPVAEKMVSYFRAEMRSTAEAKGRRGDLAEAMVDASVEIPDLVPAGKLLTLDTGAALAWNMADARAADVQGVLSVVGLEGHVVESATENWAERIVRFVTDPVVTGLLMSLGTLGVLIELYSPGLGLPGALGVLCLSLFFGGHLLVHLAGLEELLVFALGAGLLALEAFVIPGFGIAGILGIFCVVAALMLTLVGLPIDVLLSTGAWVGPLSRVALALLATLVGLLIAVRFLPRTRAMRGLVLRTALSSGILPHPPESFMAADHRRFVGQIGLAECDLRPTGIARFGDARVDVVSEGGYVSKGTRVRVLEVEGARIVVRPEDSA